MSELDHRLASAEAHLSAIMESSTDAIVTVAEDGTISFWNRGAAEMFGVAAEDAIGTSVTRFIPARFHATHRQGFAKFARAGQAARPTAKAEITGLRADGAEFPCEAMLSSFTVGGQQHLMAIIRDTSERSAQDARVNEALERMARQRNELQALFDVMPVGVGIARGRDAHEIEINPEFGRQLGIDPRLNASKSAPAGDNLPFRLFSEGKEVAAEDLPLQISARTGQSVSDVVVDVVREDGVVVELLEYAAPVFDDRGEVSGSVGAFIDVTHRNISERALQAAEARLAGIIDSATDAIITVTPDHRIQLFNRGAEAIFRVASEQMLGKDISILIPSRFLSRHDAYMEEFATSGVTERAMSAREIAGVRADGEEFPAEARISQVDVGGQKLLTVILRDITERKRAEAAAHRAEARLAGIIDSATDAIITVTDDHRIQLFNRGAETIFRVAAEEMLGKDISVLIPARFLSRHDAYMEEFATSGVTERAMSAREIAGVRADGEEFPAEARISQVQVGDQKLLTVILRDITDRKRAESELREAKEFSDRVVSSVTNGLATFDTGLHFRFVNPQGLAILGLSGVEEIAGKHVSSVFDEDTGVAVVQAFERVREGRQPLGGMEGEVIQPDGSRRWISFGLAPLLDGDRVVGFVGAAEDTTDRRRAEQAMLQTQKLESLGVLAGGIAHDFNNLLVGILGNAGLAMLEMAPESPGRETIREIEVAGQRAADLIRQMLAYSGRGRFVIEKIELNTLVEEMGHLLRLSISKTAVVKHQFTRPLPLVSVDATQLRQLVMNLVVNASDAIGEREGTIIVRTGALHADKEYLRDMYLAENLEEGTYVFLEVSDTGSGMDAETEAKIFDPFFTTKFTGRGLGLAAVLGIVRGHRGAIRVYSELGHGTTFKVLLPAAVDGGGGGAQEASAAPEVEQSKGTVLVIDDEETVRQVTQRALGRIGFDVLVARDGQEGVETFRAHTDAIVCVLLDLTMPRMSGEEAFHEMRRIRSATPVIIMSGYSEQDTMERFAGRPPNGFIQKPYDLATLYAAIRAALGGA